MFGRTGTKRSVKVTRSSGRKAMLKRVAKAKRARARDKGKRKRLG